MKVKVPLRDSTMKISRHWLEIEGDGDDYRVSLQNDKGVVGGGDPAPIKKVLLENLAGVGAGVILKNGPLRFYKTDEDVRVSFTEEEEGQLGFDRLDTKEFTQAIHKVLGDGSVDDEPHKRRPAPKKRAASKSKRHVTKSSKRA